MIVAALVSALLLASPQAGIQHGEQAVPQQSAHVESSGQAEEGHGESEGVDFMHHIVDSREIELPWTTVHLPEKGSWMVGPIDMTPTKHVVFLWIAAALVLLVLLFASRAARRTHGGPAQGRRYNLIEAMVLFVRDQVVMQNIGPGGAKFAPLIITLFFFILFANLLGLVPWGSTATANIGVTAGLALIALVVVEGSGMAKLGPAGYLGTIFHRPSTMGPVGQWTMAIALAPVEFIGKLTKPFALAIRLMANMTAGHIVILSLINLIFVFGALLGSLALAGAIFPLVMAIAIMFLELFVAFLQAYVFAILTSVFIGQMQHAHH